MEINETEFWKELGKLSLAVRDRVFDQYTPQIEDKFNCKIINRAYGDLGRITNPVMPVQDTIRNICYLKEFVPNDSDRGL